jgi:nucleoside-diphosphate-sugar epimerase
MKKALITGATGCVGRHLCEHLIKRGYQVTGTGRNAAIGRKLQNLGVTFLEGDLTTLDLDPLFANQPDIVFHSAAFSSAWGRREDFFKINVSATERLFDAANRHKVKRFVFLSSPSIYFNFTDRYNLREDAPLPQTPVNAYAESKIAAENILLIPPFNGTERIIIRPRGILGPYDSALAPRLAQAVQNGPLPRLRGGQALVDYTCVQNLVHALHLCAAHTGDLDGHIFNISNDAPVTVQTLLQKSLDALDLTATWLPVPVWLARALARFGEARARRDPAFKEPRITEYAIGLLAYGQTLDITAAKDILGYRPVVTLDEGLASLKDWWRTRHDD